MKRFSPRLAAGMAFLALALAGCGSNDGDGGGASGFGGGPGGGPGTPVSQVPASAQQSVDGLIAFVKELIGQTSERTEPIVLGDAVLPTSDTAEPSN